MRESSLCGLRAPASAGALLILAPPCPRLLPAPQRACPAVSRAELQDLLPGIINQLGPDNLANLKKLASQYQGQAGAADAADDDDDDDDVPDLVEGEFPGSTACILIPDWEAP